MAIVRTKKAISTQISKAAAVFSDGSIHDLKSLRRRGVSSTLISGLVEEGLVERVGCGRYRAAEVDHSDYDEFARVAARHPAAVICLRSAAMYHGMTTALPYEVYVSLPHEKRPPSSSEGNVKTYRWRNSDLFSVGVRTVSISGIKVSITDPARTVVDYLRSANRMPEEEIHEIMLAYFSTSGNDVGTIAEYASVLGMYDRMAERLKVAAAFAEALPETDEEQNSFVR